MRRRSRIIRSLLVVLGSIRTQPILSASVFLIVLAGGFIWWCSRPFIWEAEAAIIVTQPENDEFIAFLQSRSHPSSESTRPDQFSALSTSASRGFRLLSPSDLGELLTSPALVQKARDELDQQYALRRGGDPDRPGEILFNAIAESRQVIRRQAGAQWRQFVSLLTGMDETIAATGDEATLSVQLAEASDGDNHVLRLHAESSNPWIAQNAAVCLVELSRSRLSEFESSKTIDHLRELEPHVNSAKAEFDDAAGALESFRSSLSSPNVQAVVKTIENQRDDALDEQAKVNAQTTEVEAERMSVMQQIDEIRASGNAYVVKQVTAENPRIAEVKREISELQSDYDALINYTDRHPEKQAILQQINRKKQELDSLPPTIMVEEVKEPNPLFATLEQRRLDLDRSITQLAGRELAVNERIEALDQKRADARRQLSELTRLESAFQAKKTLYEELDDQLSYLAMNIAQKQQFDHIRLVEPPRVRSMIFPDQPRGLVIMLLTIAGALLAVVGTATLMSALKARVVSRSQIDDLSVDVPIVIVGQLPARPVRRLLPAK